MVIFYCSNSFDPRLAVQHNTDCTSSWVHFQNTIANDVSFACQIIR